MLNMKKILIAGTVMTALLPLTAKVRAWASITRISKS